HLGLTMGPYDYNDFVELHANGQFFMHLFKDSQLAPVPKPMFYLDSADIEFAYRSFKDKGVQVSKLMRFPDHSSFVFTDLDGNKVGMSHFD
ncbi:MAG: hypothetical protein J7639_09755, partial [Paenibacillaceae bacterium]|nr:hypothetical protein [Paenibacillaceae bacterium]